MRKYTFILDFKGGTYISQIKNANLHEALINWAETLDTKPIKHMGASSKSELIELMKEETPKLITGMDNVWCISGIIKVGFFIINIVESNL